MSSQQQAWPAGQHYSGTNRIPNIHQFIQSLDRDKKQRDAEIDAELRRNKNTGEVTEHVAQTMSGKHRRTVKDPATGKDVEIDDIDHSYMKAAENPMLTVPNANLGRETTTRTSHEQSGEEYREAQDVTAPPDPVAQGSTSDLPIHGEKTNVLFHPTPAVSYEPMFQVFEARGYALCSGIFFAVIVFGKMFGGRLWGLIPLAVCVSSGVFLWVKDLITQGRNVEWSGEQKRGETAVVNLIPESVEWMNTAIGLIWGLINPELFAAIADTLEDVMQASVPGVIENVKVNDVTQGNNPIRILSLRALPDGHVQDLKDEIQKRDRQFKDPQELAADERGGDFYNLEATVAYHALPSSADVSSKARNMGMQLVFYLGIRGLFGVPFPVWVELKGLLCTARLRVALSPNPPFLKTLSFTLMGLPKVEAACIPLIERGANILNLPVISNFVHWAIATAANMYVAPRSMTLDIGKMLLGDDIKKETHALGALFIRIHKAAGLSQQDKTGSKGGGSDPYICVAFSKFGKPQYCTRVIQDDLNPIFSESTALLVTPDIIKADEQLSLELWDSDRSSADDVVGKVELSIQELLQHPGQMFPQVSRLAGTRAGSSMPGELHWEVGYFGKTQFREALRTDGKDPDLPAALRDKKELQDNKGSLETAEEDAVVHTPPDPLWPSGVLSVVVHQIVNLELENIKGSEGRRKGREYEPARPEAGETKEETHKKLPSAYCTILVNDELVYKTRTKVVSSKPIFEAGTERFVRDWRACIVTVAARDSRNRQHDPIIGVVPLKLSDVLQTSSQSTRWYPLGGGVGFGRVRISLLFRSLELRLPPPQLGFGEVGTFEFLSDTIAVSTATSTTDTNNDYNPTGKTKLRLRTGGSSAVVKSDSCSASRAEDGSGLLSWDISSAAPRLPVRFRYRSPVFFEFRAPGRRRGDAFAALWLQDLVDNEERDFDLPVWRCDNPTRLSQNYITEANCRGVPDLRLDEVGRVRFRGRFKPGMDGEHLRFVSDNDSRETVETWEACFAEGVRTAAGVRAEVPPLVQRLHEESLTHGRDVLARAPEGDRKMWLARDGTDWTGAFGHEPEELLSAHRGVGGREGQGRETREEENHEEKEEQEGQEEQEQGEEEDEDEDDYDEDDENNDSDHQDRETNGRPSGDTQLAGASSSDSRPGGSTKNPIKLYKNYKNSARDLHRQQRGLMQWKPMRNIQFAKDEVVFAARRLKKVGTLHGRTPDVETEV